MIYCDAHCHLGSSQFDEDREETVKRMLDSGVEKAILICCSKRDLEQGIALRKAHQGFKLSLGIHPQDLEDEYGEERLEKLEKIIEEVHPDMIGEIGLDYYSHPHTKDRQLLFFDRQLKLAKKYGLPVDVHSRKATKDTLLVLEDNPVRGIIHSYSGSFETAMIYLKKGYFLSFGSSVLFQGARKPLEVVAKIPADRLLIETDAPYQSPVYGVRHEPSDVVKIYEKIAEIRNTDEKELQNCCEENFDCVFSQ